MLPVALSVTLLSINLSRSLSVHVTDENGKPLPGVKVNIEFEISTANGSPFTTVSKITNGDGDVAATGLGTSVGYSISISGYYRSVADSGDAKAVVAILKTIDNPKPMYARYISYRDMIFPSDGRPYSYDLVAGDWLPPLGHGSTPDFTFQVTGSQQIVKNQDNELKLTFANPDDGIQAIAVVETESALRLPKLAPETGYQNQWTWHSVIRPDETSDKYIIPSEANRAYFFRVRSKRDHSGNIVALYGKISHDLNYGIARSNQMCIQMASYYLNPDGTRTMEFDVSKNLATGSSAAAVREP